MHETVQTSSGKLAGLYERHSRSDYEFLLRVYFAQHENPTTSDIRNAHLWHALGVVCNYNMQRARRKFHFRKPEKIQHKHTNTLSADLWGFEYDISQHAEMGNEIASALKPFLRLTDFSIARGYYGLTMPRTPVSQLATSHRMRPKNIRQRITNFILPQLSYINAENAVVSVYLKYVKDEKFREFLSSVPRAYETGVFLPYRLDQMNFHGRYNTLKSLEKSGIYTIGQFLHAEQKGKKIPGFWHKKYSRLRKELERFGIETHYNSRMVKGS